MANKSYDYAQLEGIAQEMRANPDMVFYYQYQRPVSTLATGEVLDLAQEFGEPRTSGRGWPIDEQWITGAAIGAAAAGSKAIARVPFIAQIYSLEYIYNQAGKLRSMTGGQASMPFVFWIEGGSRARGLAGQHTDVGVEALYVNLPGIKVVTPSDAYDAKGLMVAAIRDPDPVVYIDYRDMRSGQQPDEAVVRQAGSDVTVVAWAPAVVDVRRALPELAEAGVSVEFIDPRSLKPLDVGTLVKSVRKTGRLLVVEHGHYVSHRGRARSAGHDRRSLSRRSRQGSGFEQLRRLPRGCVYDHRPADCRSMELAPRGSPGPPPRSGRGRTGGDFFVSRGQLQRQSSGAGGAPAFLGSGLHTVLGADIVVSRLALPAVLLASALTVACGGAGPASNAEPDTPPAPPSGPITLDMDAIFPPGEGRDLVLNNCQGCHVWVPIVILQMDESQWYRNSLDHRERVEGVSDEEFEVLYDYLVSTFTPDRPVPELPESLLEAWTSY